MSAREDRTTEQLIQSAVARLRAGIMALVCAVLGGTGLFIATIWLVIRGGETVGPHLVLLSNYLPGYQVTWIGSLLGLVYGCLLGGLIGWSTAWIYNRLVGIRLSQPDRSPSGRNQ